MITESAYDLALEEAINFGHFTIHCAHYTQASNMRQRLYRYRDQIRQNSEHPLFIHADEFKFKLNLNSLDIIYSSKNNPILESLNDTKSTSTREFHNQYRNSDQSKV